MSTDRTDEIPHSAASVISAEQLARMWQDPVARELLSTFFDTRGPLLSRAIPYSPEDLGTLFARQLQDAKRQAEAEEQRPVRSPPAADRGMTIVAAEEQRASIIQLFEAGGMNEMQAMMNWTVMGTYKHSSSTPLDRLKPIRFREMKVTQTHHGRYLLCRIVSRPSCTVGISFVVEDQDGRVDLLSLYNWSLGNVRTGPDLDALFPLGAIAVIREPLYKPNQYGTCHLVRVDSPTDFELLSFKHPLVQGTKWATSSPTMVCPFLIDYRALGNRYFGEKKFALAIKAYSDGLDTTDDASERLFLFLNRSQAHLCLGNFASARRDTSGVLGLLEDKDVAAPPLAEVKAMLRRAKALEGMRQLTAAQAAFARLLELDPSNVEAQQGKKRVDTRLRQSTTGEYDWRKLDQIKLGQCAAVGEFVGPIKVAQIEGRGGGRGVVAMRDIQVGELLLVDKALAIGKDVSDRMVLGFDLVSNRVSSASKLALVSELAAKIKDDPSVADILYTLHGSAEVAPKGIATLGAMQDRVIPTPGSAPFVDIRRVEHICTRNSFSLATTEAVRDDNPFKEGGSALFLSGALFNHSCIPNALWHTAGDTQIIRARAPVQAGAEIFISYISADAPEARRQKTLANHFPNGCTCEYCADVARDSRQDVTRRQELPLAARTRHVQTMKNIIGLLERTYSRRRGNFRPELMMPYHTAATCHTTSSTSDIRLGNVYSLKAIAALGCKLEEKPDRVNILEGPIMAVYGGWSGERDPVERLLLTIAFRHSRRGTSASEREARKWIKAAAELCRIRRGLDWDGFVEGAEEDLKDYRLERLLPGCRP